MPELLTAEELAEIVRLDAAATAGPWCAFPSSQDAERYLVQWLQRQAHGRGVWFDICNVQSLDREAEIAEWIARSRDLLPRAAATIAVLQARVAELEALHNPQACGHPLWAAEADDGFGLRSRWCVDLEQARGRATVHPLSTSAVLDHRAERPERTEAES